MVDTEKRAQADRGYERIRDGPKEAGRTPRGRGEERREPVRGTEEEGHRVSRSMRNESGAPARDEDDARQVEEAERKGEVDHAW